MAVVDAIPAWRIQEFRAEVRHRLQDKGGRLRSAVTFRGSYTGIQAAAVNYLGTTEAQTITDRKGPTPSMDINHERRWIDPIGKEWGYLDDRFDKIFTGIAANGEYTEAGVNGMRRAEDIEIFNSFYRTAKTGETGSTLETYASINTASKYTIGVNVGGTNTGLNRAKLIAARKVFEKEYVNLDTEELHMVITENEVEDLLSDPTLLSNEYVNEKALATGKLPSILGFNFHVFSTLTLEKTADLALSTNTRTLPCWVKSGMHLGMWEEMNIEAGRDPAYKFNWRTYISAHYGATRLEPGRVLQIQVYHA
jgi:hypothetical protein